MFAGLVLFIAQGTIFYQFTAFFQKIQHMSVVKAGARLCPLRDRDLDRHSIDTLAGGPIWRAAHHRGRIGHYERWTGLVILHLG